MPPATQRRDPYGTVQFLRSIMCRVTLMRTQSRPKAAPRGGGWGAAGPVGPRPAKQMGSKTGRGPLWRDAAAEDGENAAAYSQGGWVQGRNARPLSTRNLLDASSVPKVPNPKKKSQKAPSAAGNGPMPRRGRAAGPRGARGPGPTGRARAIPAPWNFRHLPVCCAAGFGIAAYFRHGHPAGTGSDGAPRAARPPLLFTGVCKKCRRSATVPWARVACPPPVLRPFPGAGRATCVAGWPPRAVPACKWGWGGIGWG